MDQDLVQTFSKSFLDLWQTFVSRLPHVLVGIFALVLVLFVGSILSRAIQGFGQRARIHENLLELSGRVLRFFAWIVGILVFATIVFPTFRPADLVAGLGITTIAVSFAFKDILQNFFAGILILWRQPFNIGDEVVTGEFSGTVEAINSRSTSIRTYDGERAIIPNGDVYTNPVLVRTAFEKRRVKFVVGIGYGDSIDEARRTLLGVLAGTDGVETDPGPWVFISELAPSSVNFTVYFWIRTKGINVLEVTDRVAERIKNALDQAGIDMPYPHEVVLLQRIDEKDKEVELR